MRHRHLWVRRVLFQLCNSSCSSWISLRSAWLCFSRVSYCCGVEGVVGVSPGTNPAPQVRLHNLSLLGTTTHTPSLGGLPQPVLLFHSKPISPLSGVPLNHSASILGSPLSGSFLFTDPGCLTVPQGCLLTFPVFLHLCMALSAPHFLSFKMVMRGFPTFRNPSPNSGVSQHQEPLGCSVPSHGDWVSFSFGF